MCNIDNWTCVSKLTRLCSIHKCAFPINEKCPKHSLKEVKVSNSPDEAKVFKNKSVLEGNPSLKVPSGTSTKIDTPFKVRKRSRVIHKQGTKGKRLDGLACNGSIYERFHNYGVKLKANVLWDYIFVEPTNLRNNVQFKRLDFDVAIVKVFRKSILVTLRANQDIKGLCVRDAEKLSVSLVNGVLDRLPKSIQVENRDVVNTHNAFVNHPFASKEVNVAVDGEKRFIFDNSKGNKEWEAVHPKFAVPDSECIESDIVSLIDKGLSRDVLAQSIDVLLKDREYYAENLKSHVVAIRELAFMLKRLNKKGGIL